MYFLFRKRMSSDVGTAVPEMSPCYVPSKLPCRSETSTQGTQAIISIGVQCDLGSAELDSLKLHLNLQQVEISKLKAKLQRKNINPQDFKKFLVSKGEFSSSQIQHILNPKRKYSRNYSEDDICHGLTLQTIR